MMADEKRAYDAIALDLPILRLMASSMTFTDTDWQHQTLQKPQTPDRQMEGTVKRLIAHLKENEK